MASNSNSEASTKKEKRLVVAPIFPTNIILLSFSTLTVLIISTIISLYIGTQKASTRSRSTVTSRLNLSQISGSEKWKTFSSSDYGFTIEYPETWTYSLEGPNAAMIDLQNGKSISGTIQPTFNTIDFFDPYITKQFTIGIYPEYKSDLSADQFENGYLYTYGLCDLRWNYTSETIDIIKVSDQNILRVKGSQNSKINPHIPDNFIACYYVNGTNGNLIVLSVVPTPSSNDLLLYDQILATFKLTN